MGVCPCDLRGSNDVHCSCSFSSSSADCGSSNDLVCFCCSTSCDVCSSSTFTKTCNYDFYDRHANLRTGCVCTSINDYKEDWYSCKGSYSRESSFEATNKIGCKDLECFQAEAGLLFLNSLHAEFVARRCP